LPSLRAVVSGLIPSWFKNPQGRARDLGEIQTANAIQQLFERGFRSVRVLRVDSRDFELLPLLDGDELLKVIEGAADPDSTVIHIPAWIIRKGDGRFLAFVGREPVGALTTGDTVILLELVEAASHGSRPIRALLIATNSSDGWQTRIRVKRLFPDSVAGS
jgi:hypothetical protein